MNHETLKNGIKKAFDGNIPIDARESFAKFSRTESTSYFMRYTWIKNKKFYDWISSCEELDFWDGTEGVTVFIANN